MNLNKAERKKNHPGIYTQFIDYQDTDAGGIVYHGSYINFAERARAKFFRGLLGSNNINAYNWVVKDLQAKFMAPVKLGDYIKLITTIKQITYCSIKFLQNVYINDTLKVEMQVTLVSLDGTFKIVKFGNYIRDTLKKHLGER